MTDWLFTQAVIQNLETLLSTSQHGQDVIVVSLHVWSRDWGHEACGGMWGCCKQSSGQAASLPDRFWPWTSVGLCILGLG